ncbi:hypothetical protein CAP48_07605 [Advenella sp. S44]|uniref:DUF883 family protein n=1 Tax=Advenella sp. S44 TaxID=1982755 RepID=UPI000C29777C|nr:DUF883 family protein [Advenella sp. S44]PJX25887.1 hypothetical protein CAP48_07605 [Advenella sp. S44]
MASKTSLEQSQDQLLKNLRASIAEAEEMLKEASEVGGDKASELRDRAVSALNKATGSFKDVQERAVEQGKQAAQITDEYVHDNPWRTVGFAALAGVLLGVIIGRK